MSNKKSKEIDKKDVVVETTVSSETAAKKNPVVSVLKPKKLESNQVFIDGHGILTVQATKLKYFLPKARHQFGEYYNGVYLMKSMGTAQLMRYEDGEQILLKALSAVLDMEDKEIEFFDKLDMKNIIELIDIANKLNDIKEEDFLAGVNMEEVMPRTD